MKHSPAVIGSGSGSSGLEMEASAGYHNSVSSAIRTELEMQIKEHQYSLKETYILANACREASTSRFECYWTQHSQITGKFCADCHPACRSEHKSLNFIQFCIGISLIKIAMASFPTASYLSASDYAPKRLQVS